MALSKFLDPKGSREMFTDKMDIDTIAKFTGLSISEIEKLTLPRKRGEKVKTFLL